LKRLLLALFLVASLCFAQQEEKPKPKYYQKIFDIKNADVLQLSDLLNFFPGVRVRPQQGLRAIAVGTESEESMKVIEEAIKRYDTPRSGSTGGPRNIEMIVYMMLAAPKGTSGDAVPAELDPVDKQLRAQFGYNDFQLLDSAFLRNREGTEGIASGNAAQMIANAPTGTTAIYQIRYREATVTPSDRGNVIRVDRFSFNNKVPVSNGTGGWQYIDIGFNTNLDIREGQKVVVGKAKIDGTEKALILVVTAKAVD